MPTMPRYKYPALVPLVQKFAKENNIEYRELKRENPTTTAPYTPRYSVPTTPPRAITRRLERASALKGQLYALRGRRQGPCRPPCP